MKHSTPVPAVGTIVRYVILHHTGIKNPHYDLLLDTSDTPLLPTWRIKEPPVQWPPASAERIKDHRRLYLTFEGDLSENRGAVKRVAAGAATVVATTSTTIDLRLEGDANTTIVLPINNELMTQ